MPDTMSRTDALARIRELEAEAAQLAQEADEKAREAEEKAQAFSRKMAEIRDLTDTLSGDFQVGGNGSSGSAPSTSQTANQTTHPVVKKKVVKKRPGRPPGSGKKPGRPKGSGKGTKAAKNKNAAGQPKNASRKKRPPRGDNEKTLREVVWEVHSKSPRQWKKVVPTIPDDAKGLKAVECAKIIESQGLWKSAQGEVGNQISGHYMNFRKEGKMRRGDQFRYEIVPGAELDGPSLDDHGKPIEE